MMSETRRTDAERTQSAVAKKAVVSPLFRYSMLMILNIDKRQFEFSKEWLTNVQLHAGDTVFIDGLDDVLVEQVSWYLNDVGHAWVKLQTQDCEGPPSIWKCVEEEMGSVIPPLEG